jgi:Uma2 family endonuclease
MPATAILTSEQYLALPEEFDKNGNRIKDELIAGEVVKMPPPSQLHDWIKNNINTLLILFLNAHRELGLVSLVETTFEVSRHDTLVPDVSVIRRDRMGAKGRILQGAPDLAIEVVSMTDTAERLRRKVDVYVQNGSKSVWVVYPESRAVMVYSAGSVRELRINQAIEDPVIPGFSAPVSTFFELA